VALIDIGVNPYNHAFRDASPQAAVHPSRYLPGYPADTPALHLTLGAPSYEAAVEADRDVWASVKPHTLYWIPGTKFVGVYGNSGQILDPSGHGTMTASRAAAAEHSLAPDARIVAIVGLSAANVTWAADQPWIDVQSNSWGSLLPPPANTGLQRAFIRAARKQMVLVASGNGLAYFAGFGPQPTYLDASGPPGVILVGAHDNGRTSVWSNAPPAVVADGYGGWRADYHSIDGFSPDPIACCTSAASPYAAGGVAAIVLEARRVIASGAIPATGPLADGELAPAELRDVFLRTAQARPREGRDDGLLHWAGEPRAPEHVERGPGANPFCPGCFTTPVEWRSIPADAPAFALIGYGSIDPVSVALAGRVLRGEIPLPQRPVDDALFAADQLVRTVLYPEI
jgi:hypothetical protein